MAKSILSVSFTQSKKALVTTGTVALRETVEVIVAGGYALIAEGLVFRVQDRYNQGETVPVAQFPLTGDTWTRCDSAGTAYVSGPTTGFTCAKGDLVLNTVEAVAAFTNVQNMSFKTFNVLIYTTVTKALEANGVLSVMNFPSAVTTDPITIDQAASVAALTARTVELEARATITPVYTDFNGMDAMPDGTLHELRTKTQAILAKLMGN